MGAIVTHAILRMILHELLAIETNLEGQAAKARADLANTFDKQLHLHLCQNLKS